MVVFLHTVVTVCVHSHGVHAVAVWFEVPHVAVQVHHVYCGAVVWVHVQLGVVSHAYVSS